MSETDQRFQASKPYRPLENNHYNSVLEIAIDALKVTRERVKDMQNEGTAFERALYTARDGSSKLMLSVDKEAERECRKYLLHHLSNICVLGEELLWPDDFETLDLRKKHVTGKLATGDGDELEPREGAETKLTFILDMIDGSDLIERGLGNWCSALVAFHPGPHPTPPRILFSLVQNADDTIYGADDVGTFKIAPNSRRGDELPPLRGPQVRKLLRTNHKLMLPEENDQIAVCFYGQKSNHLTTIPPGFLSWLEGRPQELKKRLRIYNLAGNPMMVRLSNGENIHAVFEHRGQFAHDAAPGAYIGLKAKAHLHNLKTGSEITAEDLAVGLLTPSMAKFRYVLASTEELATQLTGALRDRQRTSHACFNCPECGKATISSKNSQLLHCGIPMVQKERRGRQDIQIAN